MQIRRFVTAADADGRIVVRADGVVLDTETSGPVAVLWGFDDIPELPVGPGDIGPEHTERGLFPPLGGASVNLVVFPPVDEYVPHAEEIEMGEAGLVTPDDGGYMHRTDSIDLMLVLEGEVALRHPGIAEEVTLHVGDFIVQNGEMHEWENRSPRRCVMACFVLPARRAGGT
jgi:hypothetical protein